MATVSVREAAARLGCSTQYAGRLLADGRIAGEREGRTWRVDAQSLEDFIARRESTGTGSVPVVTMARTDSAPAHEPAYATASGAAHGAAPGAVLSAPRPTLHPSGGHSTAGHSTAAHAAAAHPTARPVHHGTTTARDKAGEDWLALQRENEMLKASVAHLTAALAEVSAAMGPLVESRPS